MAVSQKEEFYIPVRVHQQMHPLKAPERCGEFYISILRALAMGYWKGVLDTAVILWVDGSRALEHLDSSRSPQ